MNEIKSTNPKETSGYAFFSQNLILVRLTKYIIYKRLEVRIMVKWTLLIVGIIVILMGILGFIPGLGLGPAWYAVIKIIVGAVALIIAFMGKKK
jgi:hypothetical protein